MNQPALNDLAARKQEVRMRMRAWRAGLSAAWAARASEVIAGRVADSGLLSAGASVCSYLSLPGEVDTRPLHAHCAEQGVRLCVPVFDAARRRYAWSWYEPGDPLRNGPWDVPEPALPRPAPRCPAGLFLVPAVAVDRQGRRLGRGGGWYDRLLGACHATRAALVFTPQVTGRLPDAAHDVRMDWLFTENEALCFRTHNTTHNPVNKQRAAPTPGGAMEDR